MIHLILFWRVFIFSIWIWQTFAYSKSIIRIKFEMCSQLTIKTLEKCHWHRSSVFILNLEQFSHLIPPGNKTSWGRLSVRPSDVAGTCQMKHPTTSQWNVAKTSQKLVFTTSYWYVVATSQGDVITTSHQYVSTTSQISLKWNT